MFTFKIRIRSEQTGLHNLEDIDVIHHLKPCKRILFSSAILCLSSNVHNQAVGPEVQSQNSPSRARGWRWGNLQLK